LKKLQLLPLLPQLPVPVLPLLRPVLQLQLLLPLLQLLLPPLQLLLPPLQLLLLPLPPQLPLPYRSILLTMVKQTASSSHISRENTLGTSNNYTTRTQSRGMRRRRLQLTTR